MFQFRRFGDVSVRILSEAEDIFAYVYFDNVSDANDALDADVEIVFNDQRAVVKPIFGCSSNRSGMLFTNHLGSFNDHYLGISPSSQE
jgi:RNA recognition motif. (a.k.a. RRM, RBD, or RNP domain)